MNITRPDLTEIPAYYHKYVALVQGDDLLTALESDRKAMTEFIAKIPSDKLLYAYAEGKWTIAQVLTHITDSERMFTYRAMRFSRNDQTPLPGGDEDLHAKYADADKRTFADIADEFDAVRNSTIHLYRHLTDEMLDRFGTANNLRITPRAIGWVTAGHSTHHRNIITERYL